MEAVRYIAAVNQALDEEMARDESVFIIGEDVGPSGGAFGATRNLYNKYGARRVVDTPISEAAVVGLAAGAASCGLRPVVEIMFMDFITTCMDGLVNQIAKMRFMFGNQYGCPLVLRTPCGGGFHAGPQHSQCLEAWLAHIPGLTVAMPATPRDAKGLLKSAIRSDDPVVFVENKTLYGLKGPVPDELEEAIPLGKAEVVKRGADATVVCASRMVHQSLKAAEMLQKEGIDIEVIDLRTIKPWDREAVYDSVGKTHRLVIAQEAVKDFGFGAEIAASAAEDILDELDAPVLRIGAPDSPAPFALEEEYLPDAEDVRDKVIASVKALL